MEKKAKKTEKQKDIVEMSLVNPHAAGIDIGDTEHVVAVPAGDIERRVILGRLVKPAADLRGHPGRGCEPILEPCLCGPEMPLIPPTLDVLTMHPLPWRFISGSTSCSST